MRQSVVIVALLGLGLVSLTQCSHGRRAELVEARPNCPTADSAAYFFPGGMFAAGESDGAFTRNWYSKHLARMEEPSLSCAAMAAEVSYRFLLLRTWGPPIAVRIQRTGAEVRLEAIRLSGVGGYDPGTIARRQTMTLTNADWARLDSALGTAQFWRAPTIIERIGADGAEWIVEGRRGNIYHVVDRWTPPSDDAFRALGVVFLELAGWHDSEKPY